MNRSTIALSDRVLIDTAWVDGFIERERLPAQFRALIGQVHAPVAARIALAARGLGTPLRVGLCGSQGSGKSTMAAVLRALLVAQGLRTAVLSIDDLYLTHAQRQILSRDVHPLLLTRGVPGTHDVPLGIDTFASLGNLGQVALPAFDKRSDDRCPRDQWPLVQAPVDVILLEGWCVGALPEAAQALATPINALERDEDPQGRWRKYVNDALDGPYRALFGPLQLLLLLKAPSFDVVYGWRLEQEHKLRTSVQAAHGDLSRVMDDTQVARFIAHYERITRRILQEMPGRADVLIELDAARAPQRLLGA